MREEIGEREKDRGGEEEEEGEEEEARERLKDDRNPKLGGPPGPPPRNSLRHRHRVEDRIPLCRFNIGSKVFIQSGPGAAIIPFYLQGLTHFEIVCQALLIFSTQSC